MLTVTAFVVGSTAAGTGVGAVLASLGAVSVSPLSAETRVVLLVTTLGALFFVELRRLPTPTRQVNEEWMHTYRGWVYGFGYGAQLGTGVATVVTTATVYAALTTAFFTADAVAGSIIGATFGLLRGISLLAGMRIRSPRALVRLDAALRNGERWARSFASTSHAAIVLVCLGWLAR